jgi:hypothetical protein
MNPPTMSPTLRTLEAQKKRREKDSEWHLMSQIKELNKLLTEERSKHSVVKGIEPAPKPRCVALDRRARRGTA